MCLVTIGAHPGFSWTVEACHRSFLFATRTHGHGESPGSSSSLAVATANVENANISNSGDLCRIAHIKDGHPENGHWSTDLSC